MPTRLPHHVNNDLWAQKSMPSRDRNWRPQKQLLLPPVVTLRLFCTSSNGLQSQSLTPLRGNSSSLAMITLLSIVSGADSQIRRMSRHCREEQLKYTTHALALLGGEGEVETKAWNFSMCNRKEPCMEKKKVERVYTTHIYYKIVDRKPLGRMF